MADNQTNFIPSLNDRFRLLENERRTTWTQEALAINATQRATLRQEHPTSHHALAGHILPDIVLRERSGHEVTLREIAGDKKTVLIFFRFSTCPACNIALPYYRDTLWPHLHSNNIRLAAISPQPFPALAKIIDQHDLPFPVFADPELGFERQLGITYIYDDASREAAEANGTTSQWLNGTDEWELPKPTVLILTPDLKVNFIDISPDWMERTETNSILSALGLDAGARSNAA